MKARLSVRSWAGLRTLCKTRVSPESTLLTFASIMRAIFECRVAV